ncbi:MAG: hypothetical protein LUD24_03850 [Phascolarctobacterium sp.]|nr:hypothetical protein [Phascolarctobacterium sp.]
MTFDEIINYILYGISGFCFGIFASRYSVFAASKIASVWEREGAAGFLSCIPQLLFLVVAFFLFPVWFIAKTTTGGFIYYAILIYFFSKGYNKYIKKG